MYQQIKNTLGKELKMKEYTKPCIEVLYFKAVRIMDNIYAGSITAGRKNGSSDNIPVDNGDQGNHEADAKGYNIWSEEIGTFN